MRKLRSVLAVFIVVFFAFPSVVHAETRTAKEYMAQGIRAVYDNMHLIYQGFYDDEGNLETRPAGHVAIFQEWDNEGYLISRTYLGPDGEPVNTAYGYAKALWKQDESGTRTFGFYDTGGKQLEGIHILWNIEFGEDGWSEWMIPEYDVENSCFTIGYANLGNKVVGDKYTCKVEIEFDNVSGTEEKDFWQRSQGAVDRSWSMGNVWNDGLISLREPPLDQVFMYSCENAINEYNVQGSTFNLGFRCDYWKSGRFRVRNVEILKDSVKK